MIKKINIFLVLLLLLLSIGAVSASEDLNTTIASNNETIYDITTSQMDDSLSANVDVVDEGVLTSVSHTVTKSNYGDYFSRTGSFIPSSINEGDTLVFDGTFEKLTFSFSTPVNVVGSSSVNLKNCVFSFGSGASGSTVSNLKIANTLDYNYGIFLNNVTNCVVSNCYISNTGQSSYCICVANDARNNNVTDNTLNAYGETYGHGTRSTSPVLLCGAHYNYLANNYITCDDANAIYLSSFEGGPLKGGLSTYNLIYNNTIKYNVLPTSWSYGIQVMGGYNTIKSNKVIGSYRGICTQQPGNIIIDNQIINLTGADYNNLGYESGGEIGIVASYNSIVRNNSIINAKIISTGAGITALDNSVVENNYIEVSLQGKGVHPQGSNITIKNNTIITASGSGILYNTYANYLYILNNNITSQSGVCVLIEKVSNKKMPGFLTIVGNYLATSNKYAIDAAEANASSVNVIEGNIVEKGKGAIRTPEGSYDPSKPAYIFNGTVHNITPENYGEYINDNGGLSSDIKDGDILNFTGEFINKHIIFINSAIKITGNNPIFYNTTFRIISDGVWIENITIKNNKADRLNAWGVHVFRISGATIANCDIEVYDPNAAYAIYVVESTDVDVLNNKLFSSGNYLTYTLLAYGVEDCNFTNNTIYTVGTGQVHKFESGHNIDSSCLDGDSACLDGDSACLDGDSACLDGGSSCLDGDASCLDGNTIADGNHVLSEVYRTYGILMAYSSDNVVSKNKVNVTSKLNRTVSPFNSTNSIVGIDSYFNCQNNNFSENDVYVKANDNYIYGMGVLGYTTGHDAPEGQGAINNQFINNNIVLEGTYFVQGIVIGSSSKDTIISNNKVNIKSSNVAYAINLEMSQKSTIDKNTLTLNSDAVYGIEAFSSDQNTITNNKFEANGKQTYGFIFSNSNNNTIYKNTISTKGTGEQIGINLDSIPAGNAGIFLKSVSTGNLIEENTITSLKGYAIIVDDEAINNRIIKNKLDSEKGVGDDAINNTEDNFIEGNWKYTFKSRIDTKFTSNYLETLTISMTIDSGTVVKFFIGDNEIGTATSVNGKATLNYKLDESLTPTKYTIKAIASKKNYQEKEIKSNLVINKGNLDVLFEDVSVAYNEGKGTFTATVKNSLGEGVSGLDVKFYIYSEGMYVPLVSTTTDGTGVATSVTDLAYGLGDYVISANVSDTGKIKKFNSINKKANLIINNAGIKLMFDDVSANRLSKVTFTATVSDAHNDGVSGLNVKFYKANELIGSALSDENGVASLVIDNISYDVGDYVISANVSGNVIDSISKQANLKVSAAQISIKLYSNVYSNGVLAKLMDTNGNPLSDREIMVKVGDIEYNATTDSNGNIRMPNIGHGRYIINIVFAGDDIYKAKKISYSATVIPAIVDNDDYSVYQGGSVDYKVRVVGSDGKYVGANKKVILNVGDASYELSTDKNGYVSKSLKFNSTGSYEVSCEFNGDKVSNMIIVKSIIIGNDIHQNKAKVTNFSVKIVNSATGEALANEEVLFKLNGIFYSALSDKNGIATISFTNLDIGKYAIYSEYCGSTIKNIIQIK